MASVFFLLRALGGPVTHHRLGRRGKSCRIIGPAAIDALEDRRLFATQISFSSFTSTNRLDGNGFGAESMLSSGRLRMTSGTNLQARSVWFDTPVPIENFRTDFSYKPSAGGNTADGLTFTLQNGPATALGATGFDLGYTGIANSEAACMNLFNFNNGGSQFGFASAGAHPDTNADMSPIDLHSGHTFKCTLEYDGTTLKFTISDGSDRSKVFTQSKSADLEGAVGGTSARVGFTASTGLTNATQDILSWSYSGSFIPSFSTPASAAPSPVTGKTTTLSALGSDGAGESNLTYTWSLVSKPSGAKDPVYSTNGTNQAKSVTATFFKDGSYRFRCTTTNGDDVTATSDVTVRVNQTATLVRISPPAPQLAFGEQVDFSALLLDQFNRNMRTQPTFAWEIVEGEGSIDAISGLFTASTTARGHVDISATGGGVTGLRGITVFGG